jgi:hypothetical protein
MHRAGNARGLNIQAHMWYNLSAAHGGNRSLEARDALANQMTPPQIAEAKRFARK